jgi:2-dehydropantoate 2-reductase
VRILILGAGGVGGVFGAKLIQQGADITYLVRPQRYQQLKAQGLVVETPQESFTIHPQLVTEDQLQPDYDLLVLAPKAFDFDSALNAISRASGRGVFLPFLNGLQHLEVLDQRFGRERVMGGVAHIAAQITQSGSVKQLTDLASLTVGPRHVSQEALAKEFYALCRRADFDSFYSEDIEQSLWDKWTFLATLAGMTTLMRGSVGEIMATPYGLELTTQMYQECCEIAQAHQHPIAQEPQAKALKTLTQVGSPFTASMLRDLRAGLATEHEHILGQMIYKAAAKQLACPCLKLAYTQMAVYAATRIAS